MGAMASQITSFTIVYSTVYSGVDYRKRQSSASLAFVTVEFPAQRASNAENVSICDVMNGPNNDCQRHALLDKIRQDDIR